MRRELLQISRVNIQVDYAQCFLKVNFILKNNSNSARLADRWKMFSLFVFPGKLHNHYQFCLLRINVHTPLVKMWIECCFDFEDHQDH